MSTITVPTPIEKIVSDFKSAKASLIQFKLEQYPLGTVVRVDYESYKGFGISQNMCGDCSPERLPVLLENGNVWHYPVVCIRPAQEGDVIPRWIRRRKKI